MLYPQASLHLRQRLRIPMHPCVSIYARPCSPHAIVPCPPCLSTAAHTCALLCCTLHALIHTAFYPHAFMSSPLPVKKSSLVTSSFSPHLTLLFSHHCAVSWFFNMLVLKSQMDL